MKTANVFKSLAAAVLALSLAACGSSSSAEAAPAEGGAAAPEKLTVIATANPHEVILNEAKKPYFTSFIPDEE